MLYPVANVEAFNTGKFTDFSQVGFRMLPAIEILFNGSENHMLTAEAIQQMWRKELKVSAALVNQEEKVYFDSRRHPAFDLDWRLQRSQFVLKHLDYRPWK